MSNNNLLAKRSVLIVSFIYTLYFFWYSHVWNNCFFLNNCVASGLAVKVLYLIGYPLLAVFPLSLLTYGMDDRIFNAWFKFICFAVPIFSIALIWMSTQGGGYHGFGVGQGLDDWLTFHFALVLPIPLFIFSLGIIIWKWFSVRKKLTRSK